MTARKKESARRSSKLPSSGADGAEDHDPEAGELVYSLTLLLLAQLQLAESADRELEPLNMHRTHHRILYVCARCPGCTVTELSRTLRLTPQALQSPMRMLIKSGWLEQRQAEDDKRQRRIYVTRLGRTMHKRIARKQFALVSQARKKVGERSYEGFTEMMRALARDIDLELFDQR